jgi:hypothetical protein
VVAPFVFFFFIFFSCIGSVAEAAVPSITSDFFRDKDNDDFDALSFVLDFWDGR